jgi:hypothetical protein
MGLFLFFSFDDSLIEDGTEFLKEHNIAQIVSVAGRADCHYFGWAIIHATILCLGYPNSQSHRQ